MAINDTHALFSSRYNFLKIYKNDSADISVASITPPFDSPIDYLLTTHDLGYVPRVRVWYEPVAGEVWPMSSHQYDNSDGGPGTRLPVVGDYLVTDSAVYARIRTSDAAASIKFYWRIYADE